jgi:hypothetical protein
MCYHERPWWMAMTASQADEYRRTLFPQWCKDHRFPPPLDTCLMLTDRTMTKGSVSVDVARLILAKLNLLEKMIILVDGAYALASQVPLDPAVRKFFRALHDENISDETIANITDIPKETVQQAREHDEL